jgi:hypothetical protein
MHYLIDLCVGRETVIISSRSDPDGDQHPETFVTLKALSSIMIMFWGQSSYVPVHVDCDITSVCMLRPVSSITL